jgi:hypothetical protein
MAHAPEQDHNHNIDSVALNYPCPVSRSGIIRHNRTKHRENGIRERSYFYLCYLCRSQHTFGPWTLVGPPRGFAIDVLKKGDGRSRGSDITSQGVCH